MKALLYLQGPNLEHLAHRLLTFQFHEGKLPVGRETAGHHSRKTMVHEVDFASPFLYTSILSVLVMHRKGPLQKAQHDTLRATTVLWVPVDFCDRSIWVNILYNSLVNYVLWLCMKNFKTIRLSLTKLRRPVVLEMLAGHVCNALTTATRWKQWLRQTC